jgi:hypothetical protein
MAKSEVVLDAVPREKAFYFFTDIGNYTGKNAVSMKEFSDRVKDVDEKSLLFHLHRGDFENWISGVLKDEELAMQMRELRNSGATGKSMRDRLHFAVTRRLDQLTNPPAVQRSFRR